VARCGTQTILSDSGHRESWEVTDIERGLTPARWRCSWLAGKASRTVVRSAGAGRVGTTRVAGASGIFRRASTGLRPGLHGAVPAVRTAVVATVSTTRRRRSVRSVRTHSVCTTCTGTCGSGLRTAGTAATAVRRRMGALGSLVIVPFAFDAAVPGATRRGSSAPLSATGSPPVAAATTSVFV